MKKGRHLAISMIGASAALLVYCGSFFAKSYLENMQARQAYDSLRAACLPGEGAFWGESAPGRQLKAGVFGSNAGDKNGASDSNVEESPGVGADVSTHKGASAIKVAEIKESFGINWEKLRKINPQTVGWITVPGADISYPVVQGEDDEYYLHHSITGEEDAFGTIFLGSGSDKEFGDSHSFLYGHNMEGNLMFANLNRYEEEEFLNECPEFYIITPKQMMRFEIFSVQQADEQSPGFQYGHGLGSQAFKTQLKMLTEGSMYPTGVNPDAAKPITTLVTCNSRLDEHIRMTVHGTCREIRLWKK